MNLPVTYHTVVKQNATYDLGHLANDAMPPDDRPPHIRPLLNSCEVSHHAIG